MLARFHPAFPRSAALAGALVASLALTGPAAAAPVLATEPLARFETALCPGVAGMKVDAAEYVVGRIRANAESLGLRMDDPATCEANVLLVFVDDGQRFLDNLRRNRGYLFSEISVDEREALLAETGPARAFLRVRGRSRDGIPISRRDSLSAPPSTGMWMAHSLITTATRNDIISALIVFDRKGTEGFTLEQLADYATFRALTHRLPTAAERGESVMALFDGGTRPEGLTAFDRTWLARLYADLPNLPGTARLADIGAATGRVAGGEAAQVEE